VQVEVGAAPGRSRIVATRSRIAAARAVASIRRRIADAGVSRVDDDAAAADQDEETTAVTTPARRPCPAASAPYRRGRWSPSGPRTSLQVADHDTPAAIDDGLRTNTSAPPDGRPAAAGAGADAGRHRRPFWSLIHRHGGADVYLDGVLPRPCDSTREKWIVDSIVQNTTGRPVVAQLIGNDVPSLVRTAKRLQQLPVAAIDLNLGCPAPIVYRSAPAAACCASASASTPSSARCARR
jgi:hypothetical protein